MAGSLMALANAGEASSTDWPHTRGPRYDGRFPRASPLPAWPASGPALQWELPLGQGFSGLVVAGGRVFTQHQTSAGQELLAVDLASGAVRWRSRYAFPWEMDGRYPGPYGTPTFASGRVYFSDCYGIIGCAKAEDGAILWRFDAVKKLNPAGVDFGYAAAPLVMDGRVYAPGPASGGNASGFCLDANTGALLWQGGTAIPSYASFTPIVVGGKDCLLLPLRNGVALFDRQTGAELWKEEWTRGYDEHSCWPVYQEPWLFFPSAFRRAARGYRLTLESGRVVGDTVWEERVMSNDVFSSALHEGFLYGFDVQSQQSDLLARTRGTLRCVELATGAVRWTQTGIKHCSVTPVGARLLLLEDEGDLVLVDPSPEAYRELARTTLPQKGKIWATPVVIGDRLLIRGPESLACYSLAAAQPPHAVARGAQLERQAVSASGRSEAVRGWFERYRSDVFIAPSVRVLIEWYVCCLGLLAVAVAVERIRSPAGRGVSWVWSAALLGLVGTFGLTVARGRFTFTVPLTLFALFCGALPACRDPHAPDFRRGLGPVLRLAGFIALCYGYFRICSGVFLVTGWGFLAGFPAVVLLAWLWRRNKFGAGLGWSATAFTAYFWTSALSVIWSAK